MQEMISFAITETKVFLAGAFLLIVWQIFTGKISLRGMLRDKERGLPISPARVQALVSTLGVALYMLTKTAVDAELDPLFGGALPPSMPSVPNEALLLFGGSQMLYLTSKAGAVAGRLT